MPLHRRRGHRCAAVIGIGRFRQQVEAEQQRSGKSFADENTTEEAARAALAIADECLRSGEFKLDAFIRKLEASGLVSVRSVIEKDAALFANWNEPDDMM